jgi:hypothetical protein
MFVTRELDILVPRALIHRVEHIAAPERSHFLGSRKAPIVAKYTAHKTGTEKHVGTLQQCHFRSGLSSCRRRSDSSPSSAYNHDSFCAHFYTSGFFDITAQSM